MAHSKGLSEYIKTIYISSRLVECMTTKMATEVRYIHKFGGHFEGHAPLLSENTNWKHCSSGRDLSNEPSTDVVPYKGSPLWAAILGLSKFIILKDLYNFYSF